MKGTAMQQHMLPIYQALQAIHAQQPPILPPVHEVPKGWRLRDDFLGPPMRERGHFS